MSKNKKKWRNGDPSGPSGKVRMPQRTRPRVDLPALTQIAIGTDDHETNEAMDFLVRIMRDPNANPRERRLASEAILKVQKHNLDCYKVDKGVGEELPGGVVIEIIETERPKVEVEPEVCNGSSTSPTTTTGKTGSDEPPPAIG